MQATKSELFSKVVEMQKSGVKTSKIAEALRVSYSFVYSIKKKLESTPELVYKNNYKGKKAKLTDNQLDMIKEYIAKGALADGYSDDCWTAKKIADYIAKQFNIIYHVSHVYRMLCKMGYSYQKPLMVAHQKNEAENKMWIEETLPSLKKS